MKNNLQDLFLNKARKEKIELTLFLTNGYQLKGIVEGFDAYTIVLNIKDKQQMVYKHAIATMSPNETINIEFDK